MKHLQALALVLCSLLFALPAGAQVTIDAKGWTQVAVDGVVLIHVDPGVGSDANSGADPAKPKRTIAAALGTLPAVSSHQVLLKSGATFPEALGRWRWSGSSPDEPLVVRTYGGSARAKLRPGANANGLTDYGGGAPGRIDNVVWLDLDIEATNRAGPEHNRAIEFLNPFSNLLFENCRFAGFDTAVVLMGIGGPAGGVRFRRCLILDSWSSVQGNHSCGFYTQGLSSLELFECLIDHHGFNSPTGMGGGDLFRHGLYAQNGQGPTSLVGCVISRTSSHGAQLRSGGSARACAFVQTPIAIDFGGGNSPKAGGVLATFRGNVVLEGANISTKSGDARGWGPTFANIKGGRVEGNVLLHNAGGFPMGIQVSGDFGAFGVQDLALVRNYSRGWRAGMTISGAASRLRNVTQLGNSFEDPSAQFVDPTRSVAGYMAKIEPDDDSGNPYPETTAGWIRALRDQHRGNWRGELWPASGFNRWFVSGMTPR